MFIKMTSKTLLRKYLKDCTPKEFLERQYVIVSLNIRCTDNFKRNCIAINALYPSGSTITEFMNSRSKSEFKAFRNEYREQLLKSEFTIGTLVEATCSEGYDIVLLCTETDNRMMYLDILGASIEKRYGVPCVWYKEYKQHKPKALPAKERKLAIARARAAVYDSGKQEFISRFNSNQKLRAETISHMSMDDKIELLDAMGLYEKGMSKREVKELLEEKFH